ncbi:peptidase inhibitor family I36 protein [Lentzea tibetensis]|uniref:peptidase inhibitor family I36 protein n=1 Tax=Lentzea tibetensis TaxID=2591470 RepID=UPI001649789C|nr:peptidase inhibitor family I36 protein [Lentzea tibetensis]
MIFSVTPVASAKPLAPRLIEIAAGKVNCLAGYVCVWTELNYAGRGVAVYATELSWAAWPAQFAFMHDNAQSIFNNGFLNDPSPDVILARDVQHRGGFTVVCNGDSMADLPLDTNGTWANGVFYTKSWGNVVSSNLWLNARSCRGTSTAMEPTPAHDVQESVEYLTRTYRVGRDEALRRLELQRTIPELQKRLLAAHPDNYAGIQLDQQGGGVLVISATAPDALTTTLAGEKDIAHIRTNQVRWSMRDLRSTADEVAAKLGAPYVAEVDESRNQVLALADPAKVNQEAATRAAQVLAAYGDKVVRQDISSRAVRDDVQAPRPSAAQSYEQPCPVASCWPPMMGGYRLDVTRDTAGTWGGCSAGFNVKGDKNGQVYTLTAGHCVLTPNHQKEDRTYHNGIPVNTERGSIAQYPDDGILPADYALLPYQQTGDTNWADHWINKRAKKNGVFVRCQAGTRPCNPEFTYMAGMMPVLDMKRGEVVCATGSANVETTNTDHNNGYEAGTRCGQFFGVLSFYLLTDICSREGDSGGPLFSQVNRKAYGILKGSIPGKPGPCQVGNEESDYTPLQGLLNQAERKSGNTAGLRVMDDRDNR